MTSGTGSSTAATLLTDVRASRREADAAEARILANTLAWCELHITDVPEDAATWGDTPVRLGGEGCPWIREYTTTELSAALDTSPAAGRSLVSDVLELAFRLPCLWDKVQSGEVAAWRARRIASKTQSLSMEAANYVDAQVADFANRVGLAQTERLVDEAIGRFMPGLAEKQRTEAEDRRHMDVDLDQPSFAGTAHTDGDLDYADALDFDAAVSHIAAEMKEMGNQLPLAQRRALAVGELARRLFGFEFHYNREADTTDVTLVEERGAATMVEPVETPKPSRCARQVILYAHLSVEALGHRGCRDAGLVPEPFEGSTDSAPTSSTTVRLDGHGSPLITLDTLRDWLNVSGDVKVSIRPVIDLNTNLVSEGRFATDLQREQIHLRDRTCIAPHCNRAAIHTDADHIEPWDDDGPPGVSTSSATESDNLGCLCRHHHRAKTFANWNYVMLYPGLFLWTSPHGLRFLTFNGQTIDLD